ncbi:Glutamate receptor 2.7 [Linum perenne]
MNYQLFIIKAAAVFLFICSGAGGATTGGGGRNGSTVRIGVIVDVDSRIGREEKTAIEIALKNFNEKSTRRHNFSVYYANYTQSDPLKAAYAAEEIIKTHKAEAIIGLQSWDESALVGEIGSRYRVPVLSLAPSTISRPLKQLRWPSLMNIAGNNGATDEIQCIAALVRLYEWRKVTVIYEDDAYAWIVADDLASLLDSVDETVISSMEGTLGIKRYFSDQGSPYRSFKSEFRNRFRSEFPEEDNLVPGIHALRAYDGIRAIADAVEREEVNKTLTEKLLSSNFTGLSGELCFSNCRNPMLRVVNVLGKKYRELDFWRPELGIFTNTAVANASEIGDKIGGKLSGTVIWPGGSDQVPKGWAMPTDAKPMKIVIPKRTSFEKFVSWPDGKKSPEGFCISLFDKILRLIDYALPHEFICYDESYDDLIQGVYNQTFDAAVGDLTILAERYQYVDFTQPFTESGLSTIVRSSPDDSPWMFTKPFDFQMWTMCLALLLYTIVVVWFMEHNSNPEFQGPWNAQLGTALWFIFCSLFFVQKEKINNNITRVAVVVWFSVVFILTQSYTASLTSMLTVKRLGPDFEILKQNKVHVGCDNDSFVKGYLENVLDFQKDRILIFDNESEYITAFETNRIGAAFLEIPYEKIFINKHCGEYTTTRASNRFGGFGFAFQKGSPIRRDFSEAILNLSEDGTLKRMEEEWFGSEPECPTNDKLTLRSFMGLFIISGGTSTLCLIVYLARGRFRGRGSRVQAASDEEETVILAGETAGDVDGMGKPHGPIRAVTFPSVRSIPQWRSWSWSSKWQSVRCSEPVEDDDASTVTIEMPKFENVKNQRV